MSLFEQIMLAINKPEELRIPQQALQQGILLLLVSYIMFVVAFIGPGTSESVSLLIYGAISTLLFLGALCLVIFLFLLQKIGGGKLAFGDFLYIVGLYALPFWICLSAILVIPSPDWFRLPLDVIFLGFLTRATNKLQGIEGGKAWAIGIVIFATYFIAMMAVILLGAMFFLLLELTP